jgi:hypothetical protein
MGMKWEGDTITCDCGFSFQRGHSGKHDCEDGLRAKLAAAEQRVKELEADVRIADKIIADHQRRTAELEANQIAPVGMEIIKEAIGGYGYIVGCFERNRPDLALEESLKWVSVFSQAAAMVQEQQHDQ